MSDSPDRANRQRRIAAARAFLAETDPDGRLAEQITLGNLASLVGQAKAHIEMLLEELDGDQ